MSLGTHKIVSHALRTDLIVRLERVSKKALVSRSAIVNHALAALFKMHRYDATLVATLKSAGATRRRNTHE